jgi:hypothetical protein
VLFTCEASIFLFKAVKQKIVICWQHLTHYK